MSVFSRFVPSRRQLVRLVLIGGVPLLIACIAGYVYLSTGRYVSTENAYVKADMASITADVSGKVVAVGVSMNERVQAGQVLFRLDDAPYRFALETAKANLANVQRQIETLRASYQTAQADLQSAQDNVAYLKHEYERRKTLTHGGISSQETLDAAEHAYRAAVLTEATKEKDLNRLLTQLGGAPEQPLDSFPDYQQAVAHRDQAAWDLARTVVKAPIDGIVGQGLPVVGDYVRAGTPVFALVGTKPWIEANLKETELTHVRVGQIATFTVDAFPGFTFHGKVASISPATGAEFSLLPPQNATGNWVKVVQRLPVRLSIDSAPDEPTLHSGLSVMVSIDTQHRRVLPGVLEKALAWTRSSP